MSSESVGVVIDVFRAFTTSAVAFDQGADQITCVRELKDALALKGQNPEAILMGEDHGLRPDGFDVGNSPAALAEFDLVGVPTILRTSNGTRGLVECQATHVVAASAVVASATVAHIRSEFPNATVEFIATRPGKEDQACADFMEALLQDGRPDTAQFAAELRSFAGNAVTAWTKRLGHNHPDVVSYAADLDICCDVDRFDTAIVGNRTKSGVELRPA